MHDRWLTTRLVLRRLVVGEKRRYGDLYLDMTGRLIRFKKHWWQRCDRVRENFAPHYRLE